MTFTRREFFFMPGFTIYLELTEGTQQALPYLRKAAANEYGRATGTYMWQVARIHYQLSSEGTRGEEKRKVNYVK